MTLLCEFSVHILNKDFKILIFERGDFLHPTGFIQLLKSALLFSFNSSKNLNNILLILS